jgi:hypothetical protein
MNGVSASASKRSIQGTLFIGVKGALVRTYSRAADAADKRASKRESVFILEPH